MTEVMRKASIALVTSALTALGATGAVAADAAAPSAAPSVIQNGTLGFVLTNYFFAMQTSEDKKECPEGLNEGPVEIFNKMYPKDGKRRLVDTELKREIDVWFPTLAPEQYKFKEAVSTTVPGLNLDGKVDTDDFTSPDGEKGVDNQFYRVIGCIGDYRPGGSLRGFHPVYFKDRQAVRLLIELTGVDNLTNDDDVTVTSYRGLDRMLTDSSGNEILPNGTQRVDARFGKRYIRTARGKIVDGVLITEPADFNIPITMNYDVRAYITVRDAQFKLNLFEEQANGMLGGYIDNESFYKAINTAYSTYHHNYGGQTIQSVYRALYRLADGKPDPATGRNTAISGAFTMEFKQAFLKHPDKAVSSNTAPQETASAQGAAQKSSR